MNIEEVVQGYDLVVKEKLSFAGVLKKGIDNIGRRWKAEGTKRNNMADYRRRILPMFADKALEEYTLEYCEQVVDELSKRSRQKDYKQNTRKNYLRLIQRVFKEADLMGVCPNPFWGSKVSQRNTYDLDEKIHNVAKKLVKFFTIEQELKIWNLLFKNPYQDACSMGLLMMFITGARNLEAAAICYEDIVFKGGGPCVVIINSIEGLSAKVKAGTKTKNGYRYYPISMLVYDFLMLRKAWLQAKAEKGEIQFKAGSEFQSVDNLPIACDCETWPKYCTPSDLTDAGRELFKIIGISSEQVQIIRENMKDDEKDPVLGNFKDPTAYSFRRSNASHMYDVHCTILQCRYLMGHALNHESVERYHLVNDDQINNIRRKLANRPLLNEINFAGTFARFDDKDDELYLKNVHSASLSISTKGRTGQTLVVRIFPKEPHEQTKATLFLSDTSEKAGVRASYRNSRHMEKEQPTDVVVPREIHSLRDYWKPYVEAFMAKSITIKDLFAACDEKKVLTCAANIEEISYVEAVARYLPILKDLTGITPTEKQERFALAMVNTNSVSVMCFNVVDARTYLAINSDLHRISEETLLQSFDPLDLKSAARMLQNNSFRGRNWEDVLSMRIPPENVTKIGAKRIAAKILTEITLTSAADANVTKCGNAAELSEDENLVQNRELALHLRSVYHLLKEYSYLWWV